MSGLVGAGQLPVHWAVSEQSTQEKQTNVWVLLQPAVAEQCVESLSGKLNAVDV
jgi:hypothetical protein